MIKAAGLGIAYHAKPKVNEKTEVTIRHADLMGVFCILSGSLNQVIVRPSSCGRHSINEVHRGKSSKTRLCL